VILFGTILRITAPISEPSLYYLTKCGQEYMVKPLKFQLSGLLYKAWLTPREKKFSYFKVH